MNAPIVHGGGITAAAALHGGRPQDWLDLSTGISPRPAVLPDIPARAWHRLPDAHLVDEARKAACDYYRSGDIQPLAVPGTQSAIQLLPRLLRGQARVAILGPTYGEYERAFTSSGYPVDILNDISSVDDRHALIVVVNPNNPDGRIVPAEALIALCERIAARGGIVVVDEAFADTVPEISIVPQVSRSPNLIVFRSFGKFFGLAGLRLGFVVASRRILDQFENWLGPWAVSGPALMIATSLLRADTVPILRAIEERSAALRNVLEANDLRICGATALFSLVDHAEAGALHMHLCQHRILVRKFDYAARWLRFGVTPDAASDQRLDSALQSFNR